MTRNERLLFEGLVDQAAVRRIVGNPDPSIIHGCLNQGKPIPDRLLPGRMIMALPESQRAALRNLRSEDIATYRVKFWHC